MRRIIVISENEKSGTLYKRLLSKVYENHYLETFYQASNLFKFIRLNTIHYIIIDRCEDLRTFLLKVEKIDSNINIIFVSNNENTKCISLAKNQNISGIICSTKIENELNPAIQVIEEGAHFYSEKIKSILLKNNANKEQERKNNKIGLKDLTKREIQILELILEELTNFEIAKKLFVSPRTIDTHRRNLLQKVGARNTVGLVKFAFRNKLID